MKTDINGFAPAFDDRQKRLIDTALEMAKQALIDRGIAGADATMAMILFGAADAEELIGTSRVVAALTSLAASMRESSRSEKNGGRLN